jgi:hypothetical protein
MLKPGDPVVIRDCPPPLDHWHGERGRIRSIRDEGAVVRLNAIAIDVVFSVSYLRSTAGE